MKKKNIFMIIAILVIAGLSFYGGTMYQKSTGTKNSNNFNFSGNSTGDQQGRLGGAGRMGQNGGATSGEVIQKDEKSITLKLRDGGSKIIFFSSSTKVQKTAEGTIDDIQNNIQVSVNGTANQDGSISAASIQIRPEIILGR